MESNKERTYINIIIVLGSCTIFGWTLYSIYESSFGLAVSFCVLCVAVTAGCILYSTYTRDIDDLERRICKRLDKKGFSYQKKDGGLLVTKNDSRFQIQLDDSYNKRIKHLYILYKFRDDDFGKVNMDGWSRAANAININNTDTIFVALEDHLCCCYQTSIGNSKDFMNEFGRAYQAIGEAMEDYAKLIPYLERDYPSHKENKTGIGFKQSEV
jgi:hypothetical protein